jgi:hypothetical protein
MADIDNMIEDVRGKVRGYLHEIYPDFVEFDDGYFTIQEGSATISIAVRPWHEDDTAVEFTSQLASGCNATPELMKWLLQKNVELHFGAMGLMFDDTVVYSQSLPGCNMNREAFEATIRTVARIADHYDDEVVAMGGGQRGRDNAAAELKETGASA